MVRRRRVAVLGACDAAVPGTDTANRCAVTTGNDGVGGGTL